jgi:ABC-type multidrug transport system permease subunit
VNGLKKDLLRRLADPTSLLLWLGIPLVLGSLMSLAFQQDSGSGPKALLLLADLDRSKISEMLAAPAGGPDVPVEIERVALEEGRARIEKGEATALVVLPKGFGDSILLNQPCTIEIVTNPAQTILPGIVIGMMETLTEAHFYAHRVLGDEIQMIAKGPEGGGFFKSLQVASLSIGINDKLQSLESVLFPPIVELAAEKAAIRATPRRGVGLLLLPGILVMSLLFIAQGLADDLWVEKNAGTLRRMLTSPVSLTRILGQKVLGALVLMAGVSAIALALSSFAFGVSPSVLPLALAWCALTGMCLFTLMTYLVTLATTQRTSALVTNLAVFPMMMLGGSMFPFTSMPSTMASIGKMTPNGLGVQGLDLILQGEIWNGHLLTEAAGLLLLTLLFTAMTARRIRNGFAVN